ALPLLPRGRPGGVRPPAGRGVRAGPARHPAPPRRAPAPLRQPAGGRVAGAGPGEHRDGDPAPGEGAGAADGRGRSLPRPRRPGPVPRGAASPLTVRSPPPSVAGTPDVQEDT